MNVGQIKGARVLVPGRYAVACWWLAGGMHPIRGCAQR